MPPVPGQVAPGQEPTPEVFQPTVDVPPAPVDGGVGLPVAGQPGAMPPEAPAQPPVQFSDLTNKEAQGGSAQVEAAAAAPAVPAPPLPEASPPPAPDGAPPLPESPSLQSPVEVPAGNAQDTAEQARIETTEHVRNELGAVGSDLAPAEAVPSLPPQEIGAEPVAPQPPADPALPPEPSSEPIAPTAEAAPVAPEMPPSEIQQLINEAGELAKVGEHNSTRMREIMARLRELQGQGASPADPLEAGQSMTQAG